MKYALLLLTFSFSALADVPVMFPFKPFETQYFEKRIKVLAEDSQPLTNVYLISQLGLDSAKPDLVPWSGSYWPLNQGMIASPYQDRTPIRPWQFFTWSDNVRRFKKRYRKYLKKNSKMSDNDLAFLAPSEKYDLAIGDQGFDLSFRIFDYTKLYGEYKRNAFVTRLDVPSDIYVLPRQSSLMAIWAGICHGWATAAGHVPEPKKTVHVKLHDGRSIPFFPDDIKALVSLLWANSMVQYNILFEGNRCWLKKPPRDEQGRYYDQDNENIPVWAEELPGCGDVHPGMFHLILANVMGKQKRSFILDINPKSPVANQPAAGYKFKYFNPVSEEEGSLAETVVSYGFYKEKDPFKQYRNPEVKRLVGVKLSFTYTDYYIPLMQTEGEARDNQYKELTYYYDLELSDKGDIIGGQWRLNKSATANGSSDYMPDFVWMIPKNFKNYFKPLPSEPWDIANQPVPRSWKNLAINGAHNFVEIRKEECVVYNKNDRSDQVKVHCEFGYPRPQPLIQFVQKLLEKSSK